MEKKNQRNPFISGGVLVNDSDYFQKDEVNMSNDSLKASLELVNKIRQQKKAEIDNASYLKEVPVSDSTPKTETSQFYVPKEVSGTLKNNSSTVFMPANNDYNNEQNFDLNANANPSSPGISLADLDLDNQNELTQKKDEYLPDYRNEAPAFTSPLQMGNQSFNGGYSDQNLQFENPNFTPVYVEENTSPVEQAPQDFVMDNQEHYHEQPKYMVNDKNIVGKNKKPKYPQSTSTKEDVKAGKGVAWLAYILFFIPLLFKGKNPFVRWHANEGLELNLLDILGAGLLTAGWLLKSDDIVLSTVYLIMVTIGAILIALTTLTKLIMIIFCLSGKEARNPWGLRRYRIIK